MGLDVLDLVESLDSERASIRDLFEDAGEGVRSSRAFRSYKDSPVYRRRFVEAARLISDVHRGRKPSYYLKEAMSTSDFPLLFGDVLDRQLLANYQETPQTYKSYVNIGEVPDFRTVKRFGMGGADQVLDIIPELDEYPERKLSERFWSYSVQKRGSKTPFSWEAMVNDDLNALKDIPKRYGIAARRSEELFATQLFVDANGPMATFYASGLNIIPGNPALSIAALQAAFTLLHSQVDPVSGEPIAIDAVTLVVPPALEVVAQNILAATVLRINVNLQGGAGTTSGAFDQMEVANWMKTKVTLEVNYYIPRVAGSTHGSTSWFLFANPSSGRPALEIGFLRGHEIPEIYMKTPNAQRVGGGMSDPMNGDFDVDALMYKIRHVFGGTRIDPLATVASNGSGS